MTALTIPRLLRSPFVTVVTACILLWSARTGGLTALPLHNDEGLHLTRAVAVWEGHPFWEIGDGKIINHWAIALFYPQHAPDFTGRLPTVLIALLGLSAGIGIGRLLGGAPGGWLVAALWVANPYLHFYERLAFSDVEAGALLVVAVAATLHWRFLLYKGPARRSDARFFVPRAALIGFMLAASVLFKFTALPGALVVFLLVVGYGHRGTATRRQRLWALGVIAGVAVLMFAPPLVYLLARGGDLFGIARGWVGGGGGVLAENISHLFSLIAGFGSPAWAVLAGVGLLALLLRPRGRWLLLACLLPTLILLAFGRDAQPRHFVVLLPLLVMAGGVGMGMLLGPLRAQGSGLSDAMATGELVQSRLLLNSSRQLVSDGGLLAIGLGMVLLLIFRPYAEALADDPPSATLPAWVRAEHMTDHSSGYGLQAAMRDLPVRVRDPALGEGGLNPVDPVVLGAFFPDSCKRANFYATDIRLTCVGAEPAAVRAALVEALEHNGEAWLLADHAPILSPDAVALAASVGAQAARVNAYPRPGEPVGGESVVLWAITR